MFESEFLFTFDLVTRLSVSDGVCCAWGLVALSVFVWCFTVWVVLIVGCVVCLFGVEIKLGCL